ncbi:alkanesulfonate monooxygenase SsuD/methylene tetrahydromethanopterin reductase-like flavin-dependent oxidoreductase (luciferase family) [Nocardia kruczakiae]|uniref:Alkanesulfonate monooxygenase SsuD/methylene tetrahydromethanopterin reductase-like flavin-dependent oxidoreductase (Luciferase family) n=1 Tax=Nocardia kruczakiae TaxID=261477 RepID=A0ABU1XDH8_9NOCA|nr:LLM class flavin-dependent oxidoreductase [Nocardia kruczakiae]MDR7168599.1 alkanesulfonate monooxygenase SsuD/methylene tetrahydromethanopterin reductase-like flavin-dependent oxidoreductase (luciferase family) [Nocardia kruczakiae]
MAELLPHRPTTAGQPRSSTAGGRRPRPGSAKLAALALRETTDIEVGTAVTHTFARHPLALAQQALTATALAPNRFTLGIGPSHPHIVEDAYGLSYERPARHVREYLSALTPLLRGETTDYRGETLRAAGTIEVAGRRRPRSWSRRWDRRC